MKKEKMITRTITATTANVSNVTVEDNTVTTVELTYNGKLEPNEFIERFNAEHAPFAVAFKAEIVEVTETLYGVSESEFLKIAQVLPPRAKTEE